MTEQRAAIADWLEKAFGDLDPIGRTDDGAWARFAWTAEDDALRSWFADQAAERGMPVDTDLAGNQWAWWGRRPRDERSALTTGSHLDSVPGGGRFDGPLGVLSAFAAIDLLRERGYRPRHRLGVVAFSDEEGARFGVACFGSRVLTGALPRERALAQVDASGRCLHEILPAHGIDAARYGADPQLVGTIGAHIELHVEQGVALSESGSPVAVASGIWPHGRWEVRIRGEANHAGTTPMNRRHDPMPAFADMVREVTAAAVGHDAVATVGRVEVHPNGVNVIASEVIASVDVRAPSDAAIGQVISAIARFSPRPVSRTGATTFDPGLRALLVDASTGSLRRDVPVQPTAAGHDAGILQDAGVPTGMLFVRNQTGASHTPAERATTDDCVNGVIALAGCLERVDRDLDALTSKREHAHE